MKRVTSQRSASSFEHVTSSKQNLKSFFCFSGHRYDHASKTQSSPWERQRLHSSQKQLWDTVWNPALCWNCSLWLKRYNFLTSNIWWVSLIHCSYCVFVVCVFFFFQAFLRKTVTLSVQIWYNWCRNLPVNFSKRHFMMLCPHFPPRLFSTQGSWPKLQVFGSVTQLKLLFHVSAHNI